MKNTLFLLITGWICLPCYAQNIVDTPHVQLGHMTSEQRSALSPSSTNMLVFDSDTQSFWFRQKGAWAELTQADSVINYWLPTANDFIRNSNKNGFWSAYPDLVLSTAPSYPSIAPTTGPGTRIMWIAPRSAFRAGSVSGDEWDPDKIGPFSTAFGFGAQASGKYSLASGFMTLAKGAFSTALGERSVAGEGASAIGFRATASGTTSTALGASATASATGSTAIGYSVTASGRFSLAMGFSTTASGNYSTAMGTDVSTNGYAGSFIIGDYEPTAGTNTLNSPNANTMVMRFRGGYWLFTNKAGSSGVKLAANGNSWASVSDSTKKENFLPADTEAVLRNVAQMRIGTWNYKGQDPARHRHWGVMAQDFFRYFGKDTYGEVGDDTTLASADFDGVVFAAIKGLEARTRHLATTNDPLETQLSALKAENLQLREELARLKRREEENSARLATVLDYISQNTGAPLALKRK